MLVNLFSKDDTATGRFVSVIYENDNFIQNTYEGHSLAESHCTAPKAMFYSKRSTLLWFG